MIIQDTSTRNQDMYFDLCQLAWNQLRRRGMKCRKTRTVLKAIHVTGNDFALSMSEGMYLLNRLLAC